MGELWLTKLTHWKDLDNFDNNSLSLSVIKVIQPIIYGMMMKRKNCEPNTHSAREWVNYKSLT